MKSVLVGDNVPKGGKELELFSSNSKNSTSESERDASFSSCGSGSTLTIWDFGRNFKATKLEKVMINATST